MSALSVMKVLAEVLNTLVPDTISTNVSGNLRRKGKTWDTIHNGYIGEVAMFWRGSASYREVR